MSNSLLLAAGGNAALTTFLLYTLAVFGLAWLSNRLLQSKSFLSEYFLGSRGLGVWAFALTFAATSASCGSFTGFPAKIYHHGWVLGLWIGSYMVVPICAMGLLGKRLNNIARISGAITVPDVIRDRFRSPKFGLMAVALIVFFMSFNLIAQFKAGSLILKTLLRDVDAFQSASISFGGWLNGFNLNIQDPQYIICLFSFGVAVIIYTTYGGFHAVVWTDVMQGVFMVIGVIILLPLAIWAAGGMEFGSKEMIEMVPPSPGTATISPSSSNSGETLSAGTYLTVDEGGELPRMLRVRNAIALDRDNPAKEVEILEINTPGDIRRVLDNDLFVKASATVRSVISDTNEKGKNTTPAASESPAGTEIVIDALKLENYKYGHNQKGVYMTGPGPSETSMNGFLPLSLAFSFFFMWAISGSGQPSNMVRLMAFNSSQTLRRAIFTVAIYYSLIYFPLVLIFCLARVIMPGMDLQSDEIMPTMAVYLTTNIGHGWLAGLLVAAPFAAVMSTVDSFLLMISSALVRDIYQRNINPDASEKTIKKLSYIFTLLVGTAAVLGALDPPRFLQDIIVYVGSGLAACFLAPVVYAIYWPRSNVQGCMGAMVCGFAAHLGMYFLGIPFNGSFFRPYKLMNFDPIIVGLLASFVGGYIITLMTPPPPKDIVQKYFGASE